MIIYDIGLIYDCVFCLLFIIVKLYKIWLFDIFDFYDLVKVSFVKVIIFIS